MKQLPRPALKRALATAIAVLVPAVTICAGTAVGAPPTRTVDYHGYQVTVPSSWRVVDLTKDPSACVRLDLPTVYLGHPGDQSSCPAKVVGRTAGLLIEPLDLAAGARAGASTVVADRGSAAPRPDVVSSNGAIQVAVEDAGVLVTAEHTPETEQTVRRLLAGARLIDGGTPSALTRPRQNRLAAPVVAPGTLNDKAFDACAAPSQTAMNAWRSSPYKAVGIYISGSVRACSQPNLTANWVATNAANGWQFILIDVGRQNPCSGYSSKFSATPATARQQGRDAATASQAAAVNLGFGAGSAIYSDIEGYTSTASCRAAMLSYSSGWTERLHELGFLGGVYSSAGSGMVDLASGYNNTSYTRVDHIWYAWWNGRADTDTGTYVPATYWANHQRLHQYQGGHTETYSGVTINIDGDYVDVASGTPQPPSACDTISLDFTAYPVLASGATGNQVKAAQCLLKNAGHPASAGDPTGTFDADTATATTAFQNAVGLPATGSIDSHTWTALLAVGTTPTLREGAAGVDVRRLQRSLTAALSRTVAIDGQFGPNTSQAVRDYQTAAGLAVDGVVGPATWGALQAGE